MYNVSDHRPVWYDSDFIELADFLVSGSFLYPRTPAEPINWRLGYTVRGGTEARRQKKYRRTAGLGYTN